jgi:hypothetical protein
MVTFGSGPLALLPNDAALFIDILRSKGFVLCRVSQMT